MDTNTSQKKYNLKTEMFINSDKPNPHNLTQVKTIRRMVTGNKEVQMVAGKVIAWMFAACAELWVCRCDNIMANNSQ